MDDKLKKEYDDAVHKMAIQLAILERNLIQLPTALMEFHVKASERNMAIDPSHGEQLTGERQQRSIKQVHAVVSFWMKTQKERRELEERINAPSNSDPS